MSHVGVEFACFDGFSVLVSLSPIALPGLEVRAVVEWRRRQAQRVERREIVLAREGAAVTVAFEAVQTQDSFEVCFEEEIRCEATADDDAYGRRLLTTPRATWFVDGWAAGCVDRAR